MTRRMRHCRLESPVFRSSTLLAILFVFASGCSTTGGTVLKIDARELQGVQSLPQEITRMLDDLGYDWVPVRDPSIALPVKVARHAGQWRMRFQARDRADIWIDARFNVGESTATLRLYEVGDDGHSSPSEHYHRELLERLELEFGRDHVSDETSFLGL